MLKDFRDFISRGNVIDLAIGVVMGASFTAIINSLVGDMFMPLIGALMGGINFEELAFQVGDASINYGMFIQAVINFILIALVIFFTLRAIVTIEKELGKEKEEEEAKLEPEPELPEEVKLLMEIRDLLKANSTLAIGD
jgi:large conductance mechanosensitive channel